MESESQHPHSVQAVAHVSSFLNMVKGGKQPLRLAESLTRRQAVQTEQRLPRLYAARWNGIGPWTDAKSAGGACKPVCALPLWDKVADDKG